MGVSGDFIRIFGSWCSVGWGVLVFFYVNFFFSVVKWCFCLYCSFRFEEVKLEVVRFFKFCFGYFYVMGVIFM